MRWLRERLPEKKILPLVRRLILSAICLFIWLPLLMMAGNSFLSRGGDALPVWAGVKRRD